MSTQDTPQDTPVVAEDQTVTLKNGVQVELTDISRDDDVAIVGLNKTGKTATILKANLAPEGFADDSTEHGEVPPGRYPFRIYLNDGTIVRTVDPTFETVQAFYLGDGEEQIKVMREDGKILPLARSQVLSVLSARPEDQAAAEAAAN